MPHNADFSKLKSISEIETNPSGWISPITIEYGISTDIMPLYYWRVKGTKHTFTIPVLRLDYISSGNYDKHFTEVLETFREEYIQWKTGGFITDWSKQYRDQYSRFIII